jgi:hypothetical protein
MTRRFEPIGFKTFEHYAETQVIFADDISDGYHTFQELYEHRFELYLALIKIYDNYMTPLGTKVRCWKSKLHSDGTMFEGDFILGMKYNTKNNFIVEDKKITDVWEHITYHLPMKYWSRANVIELERAPEWDGHTSKDVLKRLAAL